MKKENKIIAQPYYLFLGILCIVCFLAVLIIWIWTILQYKDDNNLMVMLSIIWLAFFIFWLFLFFITNRWGYIVWFDEEERTLCRKGLVCGFRYKIRLEEIKDIIRIETPRGRYRRPNYYIVIDNIGTSCGGLKKNSFIVIEENKKNLAFIQRFLKEPKQEDETIRKRLSEQISKNKNRQ